MSFVIWRDRITLLIIALLPWQGRYIKEPAAIYGAPWEQGTASLFVLEILVLAALACHQMAAASRCEPRKTGAPLWLQVSALLPLYAFVSVSWSYDTIGALFTAIHLFEGFALSYLVWVSGVSLASALTALVIGATATSALGLWQFFWQSSFDSTWLGVAAHPAGVPGTAVVETLSGRFLRAYGSLPHPNILGGYASAGLIAAFALAAEARRRRPALLAAIVILAAGLIASFSRSAWLAALAAAGIALFYPRSTSSWTAWRKLSPALVAALMGAILVAAFSLPLLTTRLSAEGRLEAKSFDERAAADLQGFEMLKRYVDAGTGIGSYLPSTFLQFGLVDDPSTVQPPHFVPLLVGAELGFFGLAILLCFVSLWWISAAWLMRRTSSMTVALTAALPIVIVVVSCFDHYPFDLFAGTMLTGALFGLFMKAGEEGGN